MRHLSPTSKRARRDHYKPPNPSRVVECFHCGLRYQSDKMVWGWREGMVTLGPLWWCATDDCDGAGYGFDIFEVKA